MIWFTDNPLIPTRSRGGEQIQLIHYLLSVLVNKELLAKYQSWRLQELSQSSSGLRPALNGHVVFPLKCSKINYQTQNLLTFWNKIIRVKGTQIWTPRVHAQGFIIYIFICSRLNLNTFWIKLDWIIHSLSITETESLSYTMQSGEVS